MTQRKVEFGGRVALALGMALSAGAACAIVDDEARKDIAELRAQFDRQLADEEARARATAQLYADFAAQIRQARQSLDDLRAELARTRDELATMRARRESLAALIPGVEGRGKDAFDALSARLQRLEPMLISLDGAEFTARSGETQRFEEGLARLRAADYDGAIVVLKEFLVRHPTSGYADAARYWLGNAFYGARNYADSVAALREFVDAAPNHPRAPDAWLLMANNQQEMKNIAAARKTLEILISAHPKSDAAAEARTRLAKLR